MCVAAGRGSKEEWDIVQPVRSVYGCRRGIPGRHYSRRTEGQGEISEGEIVEEVDWRIRQNEKEESNHGK